MSYLEGFVSGFGKSAKEQSDNMLATQMKKYESASKIWQAMAQDPNYHHTIREQFLKNAMDLAAFDPQNRATILRAREIEKLNPHDEATKSYDAMKRLNINPSALKYRDESGYMGPEQENQQNLDFKTQLAQTEAKLKAEAEQAQLRQTFAGIDQLFGQTQPPFDMKSRGPSGQENVPPSPPPLNPLQAEQYQQARLAATMGSKNLSGVLGTNAPGGVTYTDETGQRHVVPARVVNNKYFAQTAQGPVEIVPDGRGNSWIRGTASNGEYVYTSPFQAPVGTGVQQGIPQTSSTRRVHPLAG